MGRAGGKQGKYVVSQTLEKKVLDLYNLRPDNWPLALVGCWSLVNLVRVISLGMMRIKSQLEWLELIIGR